MKPFTIIAILALFLLPGTAFASVAFEGMPAEHETGVRNFYDTLPQIVKNSPVIVHLMNPEEHRIANKQACQLAKLCNGILGYYNEDQSTIFFIPKMNVAIFSHELGHHVEYHVLTEEKRVAWRAWWRAHKDLMTTYGQTNELEGFADSFRKTYYDHRNGPISQEIKSLVEN